MRLGNIVPADDKPTARLIVEETILQTLKKYNFKEPDLPEKYKSEIENYKKQLENE